MENNSTEKLLTYIVACVSEFGMRKNVNSRTAFNYLNRYVGIEFLERFYEVEHTLSMDDAMEDLELICAKNGEYRAARKCGRGQKRIVQNEI